VNPHSKMGEISGDCVAFLLLPITSCVTAPDDYDVDGVPKRTPKLSVVTVPTMTAREQTNGLTEIRLSHTSCFSEGMT